MRAAPLITVLFCACVSPPDQPSNVHDLRILGARFDPPEVMASTCDAGDVAAFLAAGQTLVTFSALIADPDGGGRPITYELFACANPNSDTCAGDPTRVRLTAPQVTGPGETSVPLGPLGLTQLPGTTFTPLADGGYLLDGGFLVQAVQAQDFYGGLDGVRMPVVLHVTAGSEEIYAQKLMVFTCRRFVSQVPDVNPVLPGVRFNGTPWPDAGTPVYQGGAAAQLQMDDFSAQEVSYVVPSVELTPLTLTESWLVDWYTDLGTLSPNETGGAFFSSGTTSDYATQWNPGAGATRAQDVTFWFVARDGRGGESWTARTLRFVP